MSYILKAPSLSKLAPGDMYYAGGNWVKDRAAAEEFKLKKDAESVAKAENESSSSVHDVKVISLTAPVEEVKEEAPAAPVVKKTTTRKPRSTTTRKRKAE
jgi:hypothetical protein